MHICSNKNGILCTMMIFNIPKKMAHLPKRIIQLVSAGYARKI